MAFQTLSDFARYLESIGELHRVKVEVDPYLEITEIASCALREQKPALLFERVKGASFPLVIHTLATERRVELALQKHPQQFGEEIVEFFEQVVPPSLSTLWKHRTMAWRLASSRTKLVSSGISQEVVALPNLDLLPIQTCWPEDGGRFLTLGQVMTYDPIDSKRNMGIYRLHVYDHQTTGMHWQIQKGGGFHYYRASQLGKDLEVAVALGTDPALLIAAVAALPEGVDEALLASFLRGKPVPMVRGKSISIQVPANAEFILEGRVPLNERRVEGPFGDHFGHYSQSAPFPVFHLSAMTHRRNALYPATIVGIPPMEDKFLGDATQQILGPLVRLVHREVKDLWAYYETGFHNLLVVSVEERYNKEAMKAAFGLLGTGQLSLSKCVVLVSEGVDPRNWTAVLNEILVHFDPHYDFLLLPKVPLDTLDFTSFQMELGSRMILDATRKKQQGEGEHDRPAKKVSQNHRLKDGRGLDRRIIDSVLLEECLLLVKVKKEGRLVVEKLVRKKELQSIPMIAAVSEDVDIHDRENALWGLFTRFDCERDVVFTEQKLFGISPVYKGVMGIDATWKKGYPQPLRMPEEVVRLVEARWEEYWR
ncbi:MAG: UbiD family decarboxylase [bacterium]